eukprot:4021388-Pyramimonas_sp.AAC.1
MNGKFGSERLLCCLLRVLGRAISFIAILAQGIGFTCLAAQQRLRLPTRCACRGLLEMSSGSAARGLSPSTFSLDEYGLAESDTAAGPNKMTCFLCEEEEFCTKEWRSIMLSSRCWNAVRAHRLQLKGNAKALKDSADLVRSDPDAWRAQVKPYIAKDTTSRKIARTETQKQLVVQQTTDRSIESKREGKKIEFYSKRHFKSYRAFWDKVESDDASE